MAEALKAQLEEAIGSRKLVELTIEEEMAVDQDAPGYVKSQAEVSTPGYAQGA